MVKVDFGIRSDCMRRVIDVEELISKLYDPRVVHMDENGRVNREEVIMVINGLAEEGDRNDNF